MKTNRIEGCSKYSFNLPPAPQNREVRRVVAHLGLRVRKLVRVSYGPYRLGQLAPSELVSAPLHTSLVPHTRQAAAEAVGESQMPAAG